MKRSKNNENYTSSIKSSNRRRFKNFIAATTPGGIEAQEAAGQKSFVSNSTLPKKMYGCTREDLESMGIKFGDDADDLFINVILPVGWTKKATDHSMWSKLCDDKGHKKASIFYKAAFYDRSAHISLTARFYQESGKERLKAEF